MLPRRMLACSLAAALIFASVADINHLNAQVATATILGTVTDSSGAAIADATVQVRNVGTGLTQTATSDAQGRFNVPDLGIGDYEVQAAKMGFSTVVHRASR